jgi:hypothetical protein
MDLADAADAVRTELSRLHDIFAEAAEDLDPETRRALQGGTDLELARVVCLHAQWLLHEITNSEGQPLWEDEAVALSRRFAWRPPLADSFRCPHNEVAAGPAPA